MTNTISSQIIKKLFLFVFLLFFGISSVNALCYEGACVDNLQPFSNGGTFPDHTINYLNDGLYSNDYYQVGTPGLDSWEMGLYNSTGTFKANSIKIWAHSANFNLIDFSVDGGNDGSCNDGVSGSWTTLLTVTGNSDYNFTGNFTNDVSYKCYRVAVTDQAASNENAQREMAFYYEPSSIPSLEFTNISINPQGIYSGFQFDTFSEEPRPKGITSFNNSLWVTGGNNALVSQYNETDGTYTGFNFSVNTQEPGPKGLTTFNNSFYVVGSSGVFKYTSNGIYDNFNFSTSSQDTSPQGITFFDNSFWIVGATTDRIYKYNTNGTYTGFSFSTSSELSVGTGITGYANSLWVVGIVESRVYKYDTNGTYAGVSFDLSEQTSDAEGITNNENGFQVTDDTPGSNVYQYFKTAGSNLSNFSNNYFKTIVLNDSINGNVNTSYSLNGAAYIQACTNNLTCIFNLTLSEGFYNISFTAENNETNVNSTNQSFLVDITPPILSIIGNTTQDTFFINFSTIFAVNYSISGKKSCTINITYLSANESDSNFFIGCEDTQVFSRAGLYNGFLVAEDNAGNIITGSINGTINPVINIFFNSSINTTLLNYSATIFHPGGRETFPTPDENGAIQLSPVNDGELDLGLHIIQFERLGFATENFTQIVNETNAGINVTFNVTQAQIIVNIFDRTDSSVLNVSTIVTIFGLGNLTTSTGQAIFKDFNFLPGTYSVEAVSEGFYTEQQEFIYSGESNAVINLYLLDFTQNNSATLIVPTTDEWDNVLSNVDVRLQEYDTTIFGFKEVSQCTSNSNGECQFLVEQSTKSYRLVGTININGITYTATNPENDNDGETFLPIISGGEEVLGQEIVRQLRLKISDTLQPANFIGLTINSPDTVADTIVSENSTETVINVPIDFLAINGLSYTVCFELYVITGSGFNEVITPVCDTGSSGLLPTADITLNNDFDYQARITVQFDGSNKETYQTYNYPSNKSFAEILNNQALVPNMVMFFWTMLLAVSLYMRNLALWSWGAMFLAAIQIALFANLLVASSSVILIVINIIILQISKRQIDLQ